MRSQVRRVRWLRRRSARCQCRVAWVRNALTALLLPGTASPEELIANEKVRQLFQGEIDRFNSNLDRQEKIRRFALLPRDFTIDNDEITPSLKVKRKVIDKRYKLSEVPAAIRYLEEGHARGKVAITLSR